MAADVSLPFARELHRHSLARGVWSRLLTPWKSFLRERGELAVHEEIPDGVPLVCHPLWVALAEHLHFRGKFVKKVGRRCHINLLEIEAALRLERQLAEASSRFRYLLGADSQVALAALLKGRSASARLNVALKQSLATYLGAGIYCSFGFVPSLSNVADDPTRGKPIRSRIGPSPKWLESAESGDFTAMDEWLASVGYDPLEVAKLPFPPDVARSSEAVRSHVAHLRSVQKPERLKVFDERQQSSAPPVGTVVHFDAEDVGSVSVSPQFGQEKNELREHQKPEGNKKESTRGKRIESKKPIQAVADPNRRRVAPPAENNLAEGDQSRERDHEDISGVPVMPKKKLHWRENSRSPHLSPAARELLAAWPSLRSSLDLAGSVVAILSTLSGVAIWISLVEQQVWRKVWLKSIMFGSFLSIGSIVLVKIC